MSFEINMACPHGNGTEAHRQTDAEVCLVGFECSDCTGSYPIGRGVGINNRSFPAGSGSGSGSAARKSRVIQNKYAKACGTCGTRVEAFEGKIEKVQNVWLTACLTCEFPSTAPAPVIKNTWTKVGQTWAVRAAGAKTGDTVTVTKASGETAEVTLGAELLSGGVFEPAKAASKTAPAPAPAVEIEAGRVYVTSNGEFVRAQRSQSGNLYGKVWTGTGWAYNPGALKDVVRKITAEEAAAWGHEHDACVFCNRALTDGRSKAVGYGEICAGKNYLPWG